MKNFASPLILFRLLPSVRVGDQVSLKFIIMFKSIGFVIALYAVTKIVDGGFSAFESAMVATFHTIETAAEISEAQMIRSANQ